MIIFPPLALAQHFPEPARGDAAVAERYVIWARNLIEQGLYNEALAGLERALDFADVSSDISYLLALSRHRHNRPRETVLHALNLALGTDRWVFYRPDDARLLRAEVLINLRAYSEAIHELARVSRSPEEATLTLRALAAIWPMQFHSNLRDALDRYPRDPRPVRVFFNFLQRQADAGFYPSRDDLELLDLIIRRLPALLPYDPELAWMAAPFFWDLDDARRLITAYRALHTPNPASIPVTLRFGVIDEERAIEELFGLNPAIRAGQGQKISRDISLFAEIWDLLSREETKEMFRRNLSTFTGFITEDINRDGIPEIIAEYSGGMLTRAIYDLTQTGIPDLTIFFEGGDPRWARAFIAPDFSRQEAIIRWERYPSVFYVEAGGVRFIPRPFEFFYSPVFFTELWGSGLLFPQLDTLNPPLTQRVIVSHSIRIERPSLEFSGGIEVIELHQSIPIRAREFVGELMVSETEFFRGRPQLQRVDLNFDGRMETIRYFSQSHRIREIEDLWDYDRDFDFVIIVDD